MREVLLPNHYNNAYYIRALSTKKYKAVDGTDYYCWGFLSINHVYPGDDGIKREFRFDLDSAVTFDDYSEALKMTESIKDLAITSGFDTDHIQIVKCEVKLQILKEVNING